MVEQNLRQLLRNLSPGLSEGKCWVGTFSESQVMGLSGYLQYIICIFREKEGLTAVFQEEVKGELERYTEKKIEGPFALITLQVDSRLMAVGLLAKVSETLAKEKIPANAFSAYFHDHLLVPYEKKDAALAELKKLQKSS